MILITANQVADTTKKRRHLSEAARRKARKGIERATRRYFAAIEPDVRDLVRESHEAETTKARLARALRRGVLTKADRFNQDATDTYRVELTKQLGSVWSGAARDAAAGLDGSLDFDYFDSNAARYASDRAGELIQEVDQTTVQNVRAAVRSGVEEGLTLAELQDEILESESFSAARALLIARTELALAQNDGALSTFSELGVEKVHVFDGDSDAECQEANGQVWDLDYAMENLIEHPNCERSFSPAASGSELE